MSLPPRHFIPPHEGHDGNEMTDLAVARSAKDIDRIAAMIDRHRDADEGVSVSVDQDVMRKVLTARRLLDISHQIDGVFDGPLLANPGWDILLDLFIQRVEDAGDSSLLFDWRHRNL